MHPDPASRPRCRCWNRRPGRSLSASLFDLLDQAWRRFARDFTETDGRLAYRGELTSRDGVDDFYEVFFNWPQLYLLGGADDLLAAVRAALGGRHPAADRTRHARRRVRARLRLVPPGREPAAALLPVHGRARALGGAGDPLRRAVRRSRARQLRPEHRIIRRPHNGSDPARDGPVRRRELPVAAEGGRRCTASRWTGCCRGAPSEPPAGADPRLGEQMRAAHGGRRHRGQPGRHRPRSQCPDPAPANSATGTGSRSTSARGGSAPRPTAGSCPTTSPRTAPSAGCWTAVGTAGTTAGPGRTAGTASGTRAMVAALAAADATGDDSYLDLVRPALDEIIAHGKVIGLHRGRLQPAVQVDRPARREDVAHADPARAVPPRRPGLVRLQPDADGRARPHCGTTRASDADRDRHRRLRAASGYDWRTVRSFRSKEEAGHEEPWLAFLDGENPDYPERILAAAQAQVRHRLARMERYRGPRRAGGGHPRLAAVQPRGHRGPRAADLGRSAGDLQRRPAAGAGALLRRRGPASRPAALGCGAGVRHRSARPPSSNWSTSTLRTRGP